VPLILEPEQEENWLKGEEINVFKKCDIELKAVIQ